MPIAIIGSFATGVVLFARTITDYILKKKMIEKGFVNEDAQALFKRRHSDNKYAALKWGLIIFFGGLALILIEYIPYDTHSPLPYGIVTLSLSLGFLIYYFIVKDDLK